MDNRQLNGGIVLTGGGSQLRHLIQLTEYVTGLPARIGLPNEHLAAGHIEELAKPTYSTCLGLILKGYDDYENKRMVFHKGFVKVEVPEELKEKPKVEEPVIELQESPQEPETKKVKAQRKPLINFWNSFKHNLIKVFEEEEDKQFN